MRIGNLEFHRRDSTIAEVKKWVQYDEAHPRPANFPADMKEFCFTLLFFRLKSEGWEINFVGKRPLVLEYPEAQVCWNLMLYGQEVLDAECKLQETLDRDDLV